VIRRRQRRLRGGAPRRRRRLQPGPTSFYPAPQNGIAQPKFPGHRPQGAGWALVGDAGYFKDPLTAHGITDALRDAHLLSCGIVEGGARGLEAYQRERDALSLPLMRTTDAIASFSWDFDEVKQLHADLSAVMKTEANQIANSCQPTSLAA